MTARAATATAATTAPPATIKVLAHTYTVTVDHTGLIEHADERGSTVIERLSIAGDGALPPSRLRETLLHETLHAAWFSTALRATPAQEHEELVVDALAVVLVNVLADNPDLVAYLTETSR